MKGRDGLVQAKESAHKFRRTLLFLIKLTSFALTVVIYSIVWFYFHGETTFFYRGNYIVIGLYCALLLVFNLLYNIYNYGHLRVSDMVGAGFIALMITNMITYAQLCLIATEVLDFVPLVCCTVLQAIVLVVTSFAGHHIYYLLYPRRNIVAIVSEYYMSRPLLQKFSLDPKKYAITEIISSTEPMDTIHSQIDGHSAVLLCDVEGDVRNDILRYCFYNNRRVYVLPSLADILINSADNIQISDSAIFLLKNRGLSTEHRITKRLFDMLISGVGLLLASPFMLIVALLIKLGDRGPVLYKQTRLTEDERSFEIYKFRSMVVDAEKEGGAQLAAKGDTRITPVGKFIRATRLDELPQIINVLKGDMSIVGPRPERPEMYELYKQALPDFHLRCKVKAGLTGYAQVYGKYNTSVKDKLNMDLVYIHNSSILTDIKMILMTVKIVFSPEATEAIDEDYNSELNLQEQDK